MQRRRKVRTRYSISKKWAKTLKTAIKCNKFYYYTQTPSRSPFVTDVTWQLSKVTDDATVTYAPVYARREEKKRKHLLASASAREKESRASPLTRAYAQEGEGEREKARRTFYTSVRSWERREWKRERKKEEHKRKRESCASLIPERTSAGERERKSDSERESCLS